jgi:hypothetical protein
MDLVDVLSIPGRNGRVIYCESDIGVDTVYMRHRRDADKLRFGDQISSNMREHRRPTI